MKEYLVINLTQSPLFVNLKGSKNDNDVVQLMPKGGVRAMISEPIAEALKIKYRGKIQFKSVV